MSYRDSIRPASFRGVPFETEGTQSTFGRRNITHEYPQRDQPFIEDMGRSVRKFTVDAFVLEPDYLAKRDRLLAALEQGGPGTLIHPFYGSLDVSVDSFSITENKRDGGMASMSITFLESGTLQFPSPDLDTGAQVSSLAGSARAQIATDFTQRFSLLGQPDFVVDDAKAELQRGFDAIKGSLGVGT